jgi:hydroxymethylpyrimidine/phosphomethylpyrimidine kinase
MPARSLSLQPVVLSVNANDPSGGGGITADIETIVSLGGHCTPIISVIQARDSTAEKDLFIVDQALVIEQTRAILEDIAISAIKIGDVGNIANIEALHSILGDYPNIPVVLEPIINPVEGMDMVEAMTSLLIPQATLTLVSMNGLRQISPSGDNASSRVREAMEAGARALLVTGMQDDNEELIVNALFAHQGDGRRYRQRKPAVHCHGANATLTAGIAICLAHGLSLGEAVQLAHDFTGKSVQYGQRLGKGNPMPDRLHWCRGSTSDA